MPAMRDRVKEDVKRMEHSLWQGLTSASPGEALAPVLADDAAMLFPSSPILTNETDPSIKGIINDPSQFRRWEAYQIDDLLVIVIDLMAATCVYRIAAQRGQNVYRALCSTTWRQDADGEWRLTTHTQTPSNH